MDKKKHESYMSWAIALAMEGRGRTSPNPVVGAVVVRQDEIVGEGYHVMAGTPHAEIYALNNAGKNAQGADLYVTLEPCCHFGKTPPCVDAIIRAGIRRVFIGAKDPNPLVFGKGMRFLKKAGLEVHVGILKEKCLSLNDAYNKFITTNIPFVIAKVAVTLDGKIATQNGDSKWITNAACREYVHRLRSSVDAVMIGGGTVRRDDPRLTVRLENFRGRQPIAIVVDDCLKISRDSRVFKTRNRRVIACTTVKATKSRIRQAEKSGVEIIRCRSNSNGLVFLPHMLSLLGKAGVTSILLEGGGSLFADFMRRGLLDKLVVCISPKLIGAGGMDFLPGISIGRMKDAIGIGHVEIKTINDNVVIEGNMR